MNEDLPRNADEDYSAVGASVAGILAIFWFACSLSLFFPGLFRWFALQPNLYWAVVFSPVPAIAAIWYGRKAYRIGHKSIGVMAGVVGTIVIIGMALIVLTGKLPTPSDYAYGRYR